jgi:MerR family transcriptional regulator, light-induced transcriptional regulator
MRKTILSTVDVARLFNVTETTVKRWADVGSLRCHKTPGGHRKFPMRNVIEFAERNKFEPTGVLALPEKDAMCATIEMAILNRDFPVLVDAFVGKALSPDPTDLHVFLSYLYEHRIALWEIHDLILHAGMTEIGARWERGEIGIHQEHRATNETFDAMTKLQSEIFIKPANGQSVVLACLGEELHDLGLRSAANMFEAEGWATHYIGARTPADQVIAAVADLRPSLLALSMTYQKDPHQSLADLQRVSTEVHAMGIPTVVGGSGVVAGTDELRLIDEVIMSARDILEYLTNRRVPSTA